MNKKRSIVWDSFVTKDTKKVAQHASCATLLFQLFTASLFATA